MSISGHQSSYKVTTKEAEYPYDDIVTEFNDLGISVTDTEQVFTVIIRSGSQDTVLGQFKAGASIVFQFKEAATVTEV